MVHGAIDGIAARRQAGSGQRFGQTRDTCGQQRKQRRDGLKLSRNLPQFHAASFTNNTRDSVLRYNCLDKLLPACDLTQQPAPANIKSMAYSFLVFDFGGNEDAAQQARHRIDGWKQGFRLDKKLQLKFDRKEPEAKPDTASSASSEAAKSGPEAKANLKGKTKSGDEAGQDSSSNPAAPSEIHMIVRLDFSDHEKLSHQRWLDRIPAEEPFKTARPKIVRTGDPEFEKTSELFDSLD